MQTTITIDRKLFEEAQELTQISDSTRLVRHAVEKVLAYESIKRLVELGVTEPHIREIIDDEIEEE